MCRVVPNKAVLGVGGHGKGLQIASDNTKMDIASAVVVIY